MSDASRLSAQQRLNAAMAIERLVHQFFAYLDQRDYDPLVAQMAPNGVWHRQGKELCGPAMVMAAMRARPVGFHTRHVVSNLIVDQSSKSRANASFYLTVYTHQAEDAAAAPFPMALPNSLGVYRLNLASARGRWRIAEMNSEQVFRRP